MPRNSPMEQHPNGLHVTCKLTAKNTHQKKGKYDSSQAFPLQASSAPDRGLCLGGWPASFQSIPTA